MLVISWVLLRLIIFESKEEVREREAEFDSDPELDFDSFKKEADVEEDEDEDPGVIENVGLNPELVHDK